MMKKNVKKVLNTHFFLSLFDHFLDHFLITFWPLFDPQKWPKNDPFFTSKSDKKMTKKWHIFDPPKVLRLRFFLRFFFYIFTFYKNIFSYAWKHLHAQNFYNHFITYLPPFFCFLSIYFYYFSSLLFFSLKSLFSFESCNYFFSQGGSCKKKIYYIYIYYWKVNYM